MHLFKNLPLKQCVMAKTTKNIAVGVVFKNFLCTHKKYNKQCTVLEKHFFEDPGPQNETEESKVLYNLIVMSGCWVRLG